MGKKDTPLWARIWWGAGLFLQPSVRFCERRSIGLAQTRHHLGQGLEDRQRFPLRACLLAEAERDVRSQGVGKHPPRLVVIRPFSPQRGQSREKVAGPEVELGPACRLARPCQGLKDDQCLAVLVHSLRGPLRLQNSPSQAVRVSLLDPERRGWAHELVQ